MRNQDVVECLQNFLQKHWNDRDFVRLPDDEDFVIVDLEGFKVNEDSLCKLNDSIWSFNGIVTATTTDHRKTVTTSGLPYLFSANAIVTPYPNVLSGVADTDNDVPELPEVEKIRIITLTPQKEL